MTTLLTTKKDIYHLHNHIGVTFEPCWNKPGPIEATIAMAADSLAHAKNKTIPAGTPQRILA